MITRMLTAGIMIAAANLAPFASSTAYAGQASWAGHAGHGQRMQFRPWSHRSRQAPAQRWRPHHTTVSRSVRSLDRLSPPLISAARARDPVVRVYAEIPDTGRGAARVGSRDNFRPSRQQAPQISGSATSHSVAAVQSQFRPAPQRRKPTYEQMVAASARNALSVPRYPAGFPIIPPGPYTAYWSGW